MMKLHITSGPMKGRSFELVKKTIVIGRVPDNDIQINDNSVSRRHARITSEMEKVYIEDLESRNGILLDGQVLEPGRKIELKERQTISIGQVSMRLGEEISGNGMQMQYSIDLSHREEESGRSPFFKDKRMIRPSKLELVYEVSTALTQSLDVHAICEKFMDVLFSALERIDGGAILLIDEGTGELREIVAKSRDDKRLNQKDYSRTIVNRVIRERKAVMMSDTSHEDERELSESIEMMRIKSIMCVPLIYKSWILGVIYVHSTDVPNGFRKDDLHLFAGLSGPAAGAIENALVYSKRIVAEETLKQAQKELETDVKTRTAELSKTNLLLQDEIAERKEVEAELTSIYAKLMEANKNLSHAYAQMRDWKDRLSMQLYGEEFAFLMDENGKILGLTEKALETTGRKRADVLASHFIDLVDEKSRPSLEENMKIARKGIFKNLSLHLKGDQSEDQAFEAKLIPLKKEGGRILLILLRGTER